MGEAEDLLPAGDKIRKAVRWMCEVLEAHPEKKRMAVIREAEVRFDLSPKECRFLDSKFGECARNGATDGN